MAYYSRHESLPAATSVSRDRTFSELMNVVSRHEELSVREQVYVLQLVRHKVLERAHYKP